MSTTLLKRAKLQKLMGKATNRSFVVKLSDLLQRHRKKLELPELCRMAWDSPGQEVCRGVAQELERVISELTGEPYPFVFCCQIGGKVLVIPEGPTWNDNVYLLPCRSPIVHKKHLERSARLCRRKPIEVEELWWKLPQFGPKFAERAIANIKRKPGVKIVEGVEQSIRAIAAAYRLYEFDVVVYDILRDISKKESRNQGIINIRFVARSSTEGIQIVRIITDTIGGNDWQTGIPIIGLVAEKEYSMSHEKGLRSPRADELTNKLLSKHIAIFPEPHLLREEEAGKWIAETVIYLKDKLNKQDKWLKDMSKLIRLGLDCGCGTVCERLLRELAEANLPQFKKNLFKYADRLQKSLGEDERERVYVRIFTDLKEALKSIDLKNIESTERTKHVLEELLKFLEPYPLNVRVLNTREDVNPRDLLPKDLLNGGRNYPAIMEEQLFESNTSLLKQSLLSIYVDFIGVLCMAITFGIVTAEVVIEHLRGRAYRNFARRRLYGEK